MNYTTSKLILKHSNILSLLVSGFFAATICLYFYDQFWWPPDDGAYAYIADQLNQGKVLHKEIQALHMGYINLVNALMLRLFGDDFLSLRYPLIFVTVIQALIVGWVLLGDGKLISVIGAFTVSSLSFVQFINPSANWYALFLAVLLIAVLELIDKEYRGRLIVAGFLLANLFLFRQLSAVFAAIGCLSFVMLEQAHQYKAKLPLKERVMGVALLSTMLIGLCGYLALKVNLSGVLLFGLWPVLLIYYQLQKSQVPNNVVLISVARVAVGFCIGMTPLVIYHVANNSLLEWLTDTLFVANRITTLAFIEQSSFVHIAIDAFRNLFQLNIFVFLNALFWLALLAIPVIYGAMLVLRVRGGENVCRPMIYFPAFYMLVSAHLQIPIYLFFSISLVLVAFMLLPQERKYWKHGGPSLLICLAGLGLIFQAGQPLSRGLDGIVRGDNSTALRSCQMEYCGVSGDVATVIRWEKLVSLILNNTGTSDYVMAIPYNPELYYLTKRQPPVVYYNAAFGVQNKRDLASSIETLERNKPKILIVNSYDKYYTSLVADLTARVVANNYTLLHVTGPFQVYFLIEKPL